MYTDVLYVFSIACTHTYNTIPANYGQLYQFSIQRFCSSMALDS